MRLKTVLILLSFLAPTLLWAKPALAQAPNNNFGIHILHETELDDAATLVNSNGGQWGYVTMVIRQDEKDLKRWTEIFKRMSALKLTPIIRIATTIQSNGTWDKPSENEAANWADFLHALPWPTISKKVVLFNEPNHSKEWGGEISPIEYASIARSYWEEFKKADPNFYVLPAALDLAAPNGKDTMDAEVFYKEMQKSDEYIFTLFDGWNSHSYPNPGFSGSPFDSGRTSIQGYKWELNFLTQYHVSQNIPVYITETGWLYSTKSASNYETAFKEVWNNSQIRAVTPFLLNYKALPFAKFSWRDPTTNEFRPQYETIKNLPKIAGTPES